MRPPKVCCVISRLPFAPEWLYCSTPGRAQAIHRQFTGVDGWFTAWHPVFIKSLTKLYYMKYNIR